MRFQVRHPSGAEHEVELQGTVAVLGRDPSCDLVLNDPKCSRRHAVLEAGPQGIAVRDAGSANGIYVNGKKVERASLSVGDVVRLGEVQLTVLAEDVPGTLVMGPEDIAEFGASGGAPPPASAPPEPPPAAARPAPPPPAPPLPPVSAPITPVTAPRPAAVQAPRPPPPAPRPAPAAPAPPPVAERPLERPRPARRDYGSVGTIPRPLTVTVLALLWMASVPLYGVGGLVYAAVGGLKGSEGAFTIILSVAFAVVSALMGYGLWARAPWARILQIALASLPIVGVCGPYFIACVGIIAYFFRPEVKILFSGRENFRDLAPQEVEIVKKGAPEGLFTGVVLGGVVVGLLLQVGGLLLTRTWIAGLSEARVRASEAAALGQLRTVLSAQEAFRAGTCGTGYADLEGLTNPSSVIPNYPAGGPPFVGTEWAQAERYGYRFELTVEEPVPPTAGCPTRSFSRYRYAATPVDGDGKRSFLADSDGVIHGAEGRPAALSDPPIF